MDLLACELHAHAGHDHADSTWTTVAQIGVVCAILAALIAGMALLIFWLAKRS